MATLSKMTQPVHFEDFSGQQFERLVFAYHARTGLWRSLEWYGAGGSDKGRDIIGVREDDSRRGEIFCIQCTNMNRLTLKKATADLGSVISSPTGVPDIFRVACGGKVTATTIDRIRKHATTKGVRSTEVWSGTAFEEMVRAKAESLLKRFCEGEDFPDSPTDLQVFSRTPAAHGDAERLAVMAGLFDRPAFYTPIHLESSFTDMKQAVADTIHGLATGEWKTRQGTFLGRVPSRHDLTGAAAKEQVRKTEMRLAQLRTKIEQYEKRDRQMRQLINEIGAARREALETFKVAYPPLEIREGWPD